jgi:hypothetical protein
MVSIISTMIIKAAMVMPIMAGLEIMGPWCWSTEALLTLPVKKLKIRR